MWQAVVEIELRKIGPTFLAFTLLILGYAVFSPTPLGSSDLGLLVLGAMQGKLLAGYLFNDLSPFVFSRPLSRRRLFLYRWALGLGCQAFTLLAMLALLALGVRQEVQSAMSNGVWYPMIRTHEMSGAWPLGLTSLLFYQAISFVVLRGRLQSRTRRAPRLGGRNFTGFSFVVIALFLVVVVQGSGASTVSEPPPSPDITMGCFVVYLAVLTLMTTLGALHCFQRLEIDA